MELRRCQGGSAAGQRDGKALERQRADPLPAQAVIEAVHEVHGAVIHTHPLTPPHQLHWMGAAEFYSDAVLGRCADALDLDLRASEILWFTALNLGNQIACSSYTDCALGRRQTLSPGDRRVYAHAREFTYTAIVEAIRQGKIFASNGGPVFPFFTIDGHEPGATIRSDADRQHEARLEVHSLYPLKSAQLYRRGVVIRPFEVTGQKGAIVRTDALRGPAREREWVLARVEDERGHWAITSPVYLEPPEPAPRSSAAAVLLAIGNHTRFVQLRRDFFAHLLVTASADDALQEVELLRDGQVVQSFRPAAGNRIAGGKIPVTGIDGEYEAGWMWYRQKDRVLHLQADIPVKETGWYVVRARTVGGRAWTSEALHFDAANDRSHVLSTVRLAAADTEFVLHGYGEEMPLADIRQPFAGDHWWYPQRSYWQLHARCGGQTEVLKGGDAQQAKRFRGRPSE